MPFKMILAIALTYAALHTNAQTRPVACNILDVIAKNGQAFYQANREIVLIDTFSFFTQQCSGQYAQFNIKVLNKDIKPAPHSERFYVTVGANKEGFAVGILRQPANSVVIYWLDFLGNDITIRKIKGGDF